ncbi:unnamed protein product [Cylicocyclus nassatus]|uniref:Uncharacterized protein n=1 Tax=Cylicocyclus nassatus TaxID=53992 RepID=A0AA36DMY8_CYLNA|nr:unnamed protein product [Cylicocyclus nassatus]
MSSSTRYHFRSDRRFLSQSLISNCCRNFASNFWACFYGSQKTSPIRRHRGKKM